MEACEEGNLAALNDLLGKLSVGLDEKGEEGDTALHLACLYGWERGKETLHRSNRAPHFLVFCLIFFLSFSSLHPRQLRCLRVSSYSQTTRQNDGVASAARRTTSPNVREVREARKGYARVYSRELLYRTQRIQTILTCAHTEVPFGEGTRVVRRHFSGRARRPASETATGARRCTTPAPAGTQTSSARSYPRRRRRARRHSESA